MSAWIYLEHSETGGRTLVPDDPNVRVQFEVRGWRQVELPEVAQEAAATGDVGAVQEVLALHEARQRSQAQADAEALKGKALDQALKDAGLPTGGSADEKRARLAEHEAGQSATPTADNENEGSE